MTLSIFVGLLMVPTSLLMLLRHHQHLVECWEKDEIEITAMLLKYQTNSVNESFADFVRETEQLEKDVRDMIEVLR